MTDKEPAAANPQGNADAGNTSRGDTNKPSVHTRPRSLRILLWMLRRLIVIIIFLSALIGGLYVGYVKLGNAPEGDVWEWSTWKHMFDLIFADT